MRRRTLICVSFALALHGAAFFALDRYWFLASAHRPLAARDSVIELVPFMPDPVALPVALAAAVLPPLPAPVAEPEPQPEPKPETKIEPKLEPETEVKAEPVVQSDPAPSEPATVTVVASVSSAVLLSSVSAIAPVNTAPVNVAPVIAAVNPFSVGNTAPSTTPMGTPPAYLRKPKPSYPASARLKRQEGVVLLAVEVGANGKPLRVEVEKSSGFKSLDEAALTDILRRGSFEPARLDGVPVAARVQVPVRFQLDD